MVLNQHVECHHDSIMRYEWVNDYGITMLDHGLIKGTNGDSPDRQITAMVASIKPW